MGKGLNLESKAEILKKYLGEKDSFTTSDMAEILEEKTSTLNWTAWKLNKYGHIKRLGKGLYSFKNVPEHENLTPLLSQLAEDTYSILIESGYEFFISGLDILSIFMEHVPARYPVLVYVDKYSVNDISEHLRAHNINNLDHSRIRQYPEIGDVMLLGDIVLLGSTREFSYAINGMASFEKAFVDLYYEVTRKKYPLSLQELVRMYLNLKRRTRLDSKRLIKIASRKSLQQDIRFLVESESINARAFEFVDLLKSME